MGTIGSHKGNHSLTSSFLPLGGHWCVALGTPSFTRSHQDGGTRWYLLGHAFAWGCGLCPAHGWHFAVGKLSTIVSVGEKSGLKKAERVGSALTSVG